MNAWKKLPDLEVVAVVDLNLEAARALAAHHGVPHASAELQSLLNLKPDIVDICTPNMAHTPAVLAALHAGCHVLCEKPLAVTSAEVRKMGELADRKRRLLMTAQHQRFTTASLAVKAWAEAGGLGTPYHARVRAMRRAWVPARAGFIQKRLAGGGPCMDIGVHALDACLWIMGFPKPVRVSGSARTIFAQGHSIPGKWGEWDRKLFDVEDVATGFVHFENGATMTLEASWLGHQAEDEDLSFQVFGDRGGIKWPSGEYASVKGRAFTQGTVSAPRTIASGYDEEIRVFHDCVVNRRPSPVPWRETLNVIAILEGVYASQEKKKEIRLRL